MKKKKNATISELFTNVEMFKVNQNTMFSKL